MSQFIPCKVSWTDNSSGDRDELGTEIDIYTDSPSFVPNVPVEHASGVPAASDVYKRQLLWRRQKCRPSFA